MTNNKTVLAWLDEMKSLLTPDEVVWIDGSEEQLEALRAEAVSTGEMIKLNQEKLPGCYYHRTAENDVARVEGCADIVKAGSRQHTLHLFGGEHGGLTGAEHSRQEQIFGIFAFSKL